MKDRTISIILAVFLLASAGIADTGQKEPALKIYLPADVTVENNTPYLGQAAVIRGEESLLKKANDIALGHISSPDQKIIVDRPTILGRLASNGIDSSRVIFTGAEKVTIGQKHQVIASEEFIKAAQDFLKVNPPDASVCQFDAVRMPEELFLSGVGKDLRLSPSHVISGSKNQAKVRITVFSGDKEIEAREVAFRLKYNCRQIIAKVDIPQGAVLGPDNIKIQETVSDTPEVANQPLPYGCVARRRIPANTVINANMTAPLQPEVLLERNQNVLIRINTVGLSVTAIGKAMQQGRAGEYIKVQNLDSQRIIMAKVNHDASVEPVF